MSNIRFIIEGCISQFTENNQLNNPESEIFELFCGSQITKAYDLSFEEIENSIVDGGMDGGIDLFLNLLNDEFVDSLDEIEDLRFGNSSELKVYICQSKKESSFKESTIDKLLTSAPIIFDIGVDESALLERFNPSLVEKIILFRELWKKTIVAGGRVFVYFNYCCLADEIIVSSAFESKREQLIQLTKEKVTGSQVDFICLSSIELLAFYQKHKPNRLEITFKKDPISIPFNSTGFGYVGAVKLSDYLALIKDEDDNIREELFESNIRHYQGDVDVNNKIKNTLESDPDRDFWWLNNGITIIADKPTQFPNKLTVENMQIVNGLQTTYTIANYYASNPSDERSVLVKVIINDDKETIDKIIASTNSQNAVSPTLLRATDKTQREIEAYFLREGYFYDRRKNYYKNLNKPAKKTLSIQFVAQAIKSILYDDPASARAKPTTLIKSETSYSQIFNPHVDFMAYLRAAQVVQKTSEILSSIGDPILKSRLSNFKLHLARIMSSCKLPRKLAI